MYASSNPQFSPASSHCKGSQAKTTTTGDSSSGILDDEIERQAESSDYYAALVRLISCTESHLSRRKQGLADVMKYKQNYAFWLVRARSGGLQGHVDSELWMALPAKETTALYNMG